MSSHLLLYFGSHNHLFEKNHLRDDNPFKVWRRQQTFLESHSFLTEPQTVLLNWGSYMEPYKLIDLK
jgi:hypothetical protein